ncbi:MAG TPA: hypothetical protein VNK43_10000 [Gemmatimonadales bacterium]|nr:hypothetical protein [Gemmatimonadales bacterium]
MPSRKRLLVLGALVGALGLGCGGGDDGGPDGAQLDIVLTTPHLNDGAVLVRIEGGPIQAVTGAPQYTSYAAVVGNFAARVLVTGNITSGVIATITIPDSRQAGNYVAVVEQAAARDGNHGLQSTSGYSVAVN